MNAILRPNAVAHQRDPALKASSSWGDLFGRSAEYANREAAAKKKVDKTLTEMEDALMAADRNEKGMRVKTVPPPEELVNAWSVAFSKPSFSLGARTSPTSERQAQQAPAVHVHSQHKHAVHNSVLC